MLSGEQVEDISNIDSCQATVTSKETIQTVTAYTTSTVVSTPVRRTFEEQKPFIFVIVGFAAFYIIALNWRTNFNSIYKTSHRNDY